MDAQHHIRVYDDVIPRAACQALIEFLMAARDLKPALAPGAPADHKRFDELFFADHADDPGWALVNNQLFQIFNAKLAAYVAEFPHLAHHALDSEGFRFKHYLRGKGQFATHVDQTPQTPRRVLAAILYLNDVHEGGETEFVLHGRKIAARAGRLLVAPACWTHPHRSNPPRSGDKFVVNNFATF